ncbi:MAG TPA: DUF2249 domain-containing protein [Gemmatimonadales bacterium]|nr:DUF2249 domain-containing protein [Gemmatimonadales bacterium]
MSGARAPKPIAPTDRVCDVLERSESLVEVFVRCSPHFAKLRNRALRRVMARLVTVEQAAAIAGVGSADLVRQLNAALGIPSPPGPPPAPARPPSPPAPPMEFAGSAAESPPLEAPPGAEEVELDVREDLRAGREPFSTIMAAVRALPRGGVLRLRTIFEPVPLYGVLGRRGLVHHTARHAPDDWSVWFWHAPTSGDPTSGPVHPRRPSAASPPGEAASQPLVGGSPGDSDSPPERGAGRASDEVWLDVRGLEPPEPMVRTLAALESLPPGRVLVQVNVRVPQFLLPVLAERGYAFEVDESRGDHVLVRIRRAGG